jgi:hypothetical protein
VEKKRASARALRASKMVDVDVTGLGVVTVCKADMVGLILSGVMPLHLLSAMQTLQPYLPKLQKDPMSILEIPEEQTQSIYELMQRYACQVAVEPRIVMKDAGNPDVIPVEMLSHQQLLEIWRAVPPASSLIDTTAAKDFRPAESAADADAAHDGREVRPTPVHVGAPDRETVTG